MQAKPLGLIAFFCLLPSGAEAASIVVNGFFADGLAGWTASGPVFATGEAAVFTDTSPQTATLFQSGGLPDALFAVEISFDFLNGLSPTAPQGLLLDSFFATLYLGASPFGSTLLGGSFDVAVALFDMDAGGTFNVAAGAVFGPSPKGGGWTRFTLTQATAPGFTGPGFATLAFEFYDLNGAASDSGVAVNNVGLVPVVIPEPGMALMVLLAAAWLPLRRVRTSSQPT